MSDKPNQCARCGTLYSACYSPGDAAVEDIWPPVVCASCAGRPELWINPAQKFTFHPREAARMRAFEADGSPGPGLPWVPTEPVWQDPPPPPPASDEEGDTSAEDTSRWRTRNRGPRRDRGGRARQSRP